MAGQQVKTYRVLHGDGLKVGDSVRMPGDLIPEAAGWQNVDSYLAARHIEVAFVDKSELDAFKPKKKKAEVSESSERSPKKRVAKKTAKKTVKKGVKKNGLAEQSV